MTTTQAIPTGYNTLTACFTFKNSKQAIDFYTKAFGAEVVDFMPTDDEEGVLHASLKIGNSMLMMSDERDVAGFPKSAETIGSSPVGLYVYVPNVDTVFAQAVAAGGIVTMPVADMFWGDRCGTLVDPFGYTWMIATHTKDLTDAQIRQGSAEFNAKMSK